MIDTAYDEKLLGMITEEFWVMRHNTWRIEQDEIQSKLKNFQYADEDYMGLGIQILELAKNAYSSYVKRSPHEQRELLNFVLSNPRLNGTTVEYDYKKPFDLIANANACKKWLSNHDSSPNLLPPVELTETINFLITPPYMDEDFLRRKYLDEGLSTGQISKEISSARSTVLEYLKKYNIPLRQVDKAHKKRPGQVAFGRRVINGKEATYKKEVEQIEMIKGLRKCGHSYHKIADILNTMRVPTKNKGSKWHGTTVMKILKKRAPS